MDVVHLISKGGSSSCGRYTLMTICLIQMVIHENYKILPCSQYGSIRSPFLYKSWLYGVLQSPSYSCTFLVIPVLDSKEGGLVIGIKPQARDTAHKWDLGRLLSNTFHPYLLLWVRKRVGRCSCICQQQENWHSWLCNWDLGQFDSAVIWLHLSSVTETLDRIVQHVVYNSRTD